MELPQRQAVLANQRHSCQEKLLECYHELHDYVTKQGVYINTLKFCNRTLNNIAMAVPQTYQQMLEFFEAKPTATDKTHIEKLLEITQKYEQPTADEVKALLRFQPPESAASTAQGTFMNNTVEMLRTLPLIDAVIFFVPVLRRSPRRIQSQAQDRPPTHKRTAKKPSNKKSKTFNAKNYSKQI